MAERTPRGSAITVLFFILVFPLFSQVNSKINFTTINNVDGLPNNTVNTITKDDLGFVWIGTNDGLCRYESSNHIKIFQANDPEISGGLQSSNIRSLYLDSKKNLWIGTRLGGLTKYHQPSGEWKTYKKDINDPTSISNDEILSITEDSKGRLWVGTEDGLNIFNYETESFLSFKVDRKNPHALQGKAVLSVMEDDKGWIWVGTWAGGLHLLTLPEDGNINAARFQNFIPNNKTESHHIWHIFQDKQKRHWVASRGAGLFLMQLPPNANNTFTNNNWNPRFHNYTYDESNPKGICNDNLQSVYQDSKDNLWLSTVNGLNRILAKDLPSSNFLQVTEQKPEFISQQYKFSSTNPNSLTNSDVSSIFEDSQGLLWFGTYSGISQYNWFTDQFDIYSLSAHLSKRSINQNLYISPEKIAWIGNGEKGLLKYDLKKNEIYNYHFKDDFGKNNKTSTLYNFKDSLLYIGTSNGIYVLNQKTNTSKIYPIPNSLQQQLNTFQTNSLFRDSYERIWIGTEQGLFMINEEDRSYTAIIHDPENPNSISDNSINQIFEDSNRNIWFATYNGLNRLKNPSLNMFTFESFKHDSSDPENSIPSNREIALEEVNGILYIGSSNGLSGYDLEKKKFKNYSATKNKYCIQSIEKTDDGNLWASTTEGILFFNTETQLFNTYEKRDGLGDVTFQSGSSYRDKDGYFYFGSRRGITRFHPQNIFMNQNPSPIYITEVKTMSPEGETKQTATYKNEISLEHNYYYLSIDYTALNYNRPEKNTYAYMLEGFDEQWIYTQNNTHAVYTNLKPGQYTFRVKASNNYGVWNEIGTSIKIIKKPAFWETWWFSIAILLAILGLISLGIKSYTKNISYRNIILKKYNKNLNAEIANRKMIEKALHEREQQMEYLVQQRTEELEIKNKEVQSLLQKIKERNEHLEIEIAKRTQNLQESNKDLQRSNKDLEQFAYIASHDLQEPLRIVGNFINLLERKYEKQLDKQAFKYIDFAKDGVTRMSQLITNLLTYSIVGRKEIEFQHTNLNQILSQKTHDLSHKIQERNVELKVDKMPDIYCEQNQIGMVFFNLINNAIKFNKNKSPLVVISYHEELSDAAWTFSVKDNGIGIEPKYQKQIFEIFKRLHNKQEYEGTGIGLAFCQKIIHRHGGKIWIDSSLGQGTTFYFSIDKYLKDECIVNYQKDKKSKELYKEMHN